MAAHITAAAENGPRYDPHLKPDERSSYANGIWACSDHARLIDSDTKRYSAKLLRQWKAHAEAEAIAELEGELDIDGSFFRHRLTVHEATFREEIPNFTEDVAAERVLGPVKCTLVRRVLMEVALNAFRHAGATEVVLTSQRHTLSVSHRGTGFAWEHLRMSAEPGGGAMSLKDLESANTGELALVWQGADGESIWTVVDVLGEAASGGTSSSPCVLTPREISTTTPASLDARLHGCEHVHILLHQSVMVSDVRRFALSRHRAQLAGRSLVFHGVDVKDPLRRRLQEWFPGAQIRLTPGYVQ